MNKKYIFFSVLFIILLTIIFSIYYFIDFNRDGNNLVDSELKAIKIAHVPSVTLSFPVFVAIERGYFAENGLAVSLENMRAAASVPALINGEIDYILFTDAATRAGLEGVPITTIMFFKETTPFTLVFQPELDIEEINVIGVGHFHTLFHYAALRLINETGITASIDSVGGGRDSVVAYLRSKKYDAGILESDGLFLKHEGFNFLDLSYYKLPRGLVTTDDKIKNNPEEIEKVIKSLQKAIKFIKENPEESKELIAAFEGIDRVDNETIINEMYELISVALIEDGIPSEESIFNLIRLAKAERFESLSDIENQSVSQEEIDNVIDFRFLR